MPGWSVPGLAVGVYAGLVGSGASGRGLCRVAAFGRGGLPESDFLFITVSHCAWRHVISLSKATKKRSKENAFNHATLSVHSVQFLFIGAPKARCSPERRMFEPLLLANPDTNTLRPVRSRASTIANESARPHAFWLPHSSACQLRGLTVMSVGRSTTRVAAPVLVSHPRGPHSHLRKYGLTHLRDLVSSRVGDMVRGAYTFAGRSSADSAGCPLGRFNHWWRSVWVSVFGERGVQTSSALASTVLLGHL